MAKIFSAYEVKQHNSRKSVWIVIRNDVYDVTAFINTHPGGEDPLLDAAGQDATIAFDDVGHSADARKMLEKYKIGSLAPGQGWSGRICRPPPPPPPAPNRWWLKWALLVLGAAIIGGIVYKRQSG